MSFRVVPLPHADAVENRDIIQVAASQQASSDTYLV
jgi:hypothetical protein